MFKRNAAQLTTALQEHYGSDNIHITTAVGKRGSFNIIYNNDITLWDGLTKG